MIKSLIGFFFLKINILTVCFFIAGCMISYIRSTRKKGETPDSEAKAPSLDSLIRKSLSYSMFPTSCALFICAFDQDYVEKLADIHLGLGIAAVTLFYVSAKGIK